MKDRIFCPALSARQMKEAKAGRAAPNWINPFHTAYTYQASCSSRLEHFFKEMLGSAEIGICTTHGSIRLKDCS